MRGPGVIAVAVLTAALGASPALDATAEEDQEEMAPTRLPAPSFEGGVSVERALARRRSVRSYEDRALDLGQISQLLWSAGGQTGARSWQRAAPSAGGLHPLDLYLVVGQGSVEGLAAGVWHYEPLDHALSLVAPGDRRPELMGAAHGQQQVGGAEVDVVVTIEFRRTTRKYGERGRRYAFMDCGFACENLFLQAQALGLALCPVGAFRDAEVATALDLPEAHEPAMILTIGHPRGSSR